MLNGSGLQIFIGRILILQKSKENQNVRMSSEKFTYERQVLGKQDKES